MIGFNINVSIISPNLEEIPQSANFKSAEYADVKKDALKFVAVFGDKKRRVDYYVSYIIYDDEKNRKATTTLLMHELP